MKKLPFLISIFLLLMSVYLLRCTKQKVAGDKEREISFSIMTPDTKNGLEKNGTSGYSLSDAKKIVLTIQNADGSLTRYSSSEVTIYEMNGVFFSQKLMLKAGAFRLTEFFLTDGSGNIIFAAPLTGSFESQFVTHPLPIAINVVDDINIPVVVEVLSTENKSPEEFGLVSFHISQANVIDFLVAVADRESDTLLSAKLTLSAGTWSYVQMLDSVASNRVIIKDSAGIDFYNLTIEKYGYFTYSHNYPKDSLKFFNTSGNNTPLLVELERNNIAGTVTDIDGNVYKTVKIGDQLWMAENLKTTKYSNGDLIGTTTPGTLDLSTEDTPEYHWVYNGDDLNATNYGRLYTWFATTDNRNVCPTGWHVPTVAEWKTLTNFLINNGFGYQGSGEDIAKSMAATSGWMNDPTAGNVGNDQAGNNSSGFTAIPSGMRTNAGVFWGLTYSSMWWSSDDLNYPDHATTFSLNYSGNEIWSDIPNKKTGFSVRCVKDN